MVDSAILSRLEKKGRASLMLRSPFFGVLAFDVTLKETDEIPTMAVTPEDRMLYNAEWISKQPDEILPAAVAHEVLHLAFDVFGSQGGRDPELWNWADDYSNNAILKESGFTIGHEWLYDQKYNGWARERIYEDLLKNPPKKKPESGKGFGRIGGCADHSHPKAGSGTAHASAQKAKWARRIASAAAAARAVGKLPAGLEQRIDEILNPRLPWQKILERFLANAASEPDDTTLAIPGRRQSALGFPCPSDLPRPEPVVIFFDTSGSMSCGKLLDRCVSESQGILRRWPGLPIRVVCGDTEISADFRASSIKDIVRQIRGGGGTSFVEAFKQFRKERVRALVGFSDLEAEFPDFHPSFPVLWCAPEGAQKPPFGRVVYLPESAA